MQCNQCHNSAQWQQTFASNWIWHDLSLDDTVTNGVCNIYDQLFHAQLLSCHINVERTWFFGSTCLHNQHGCFKGLFCSSSNFVVLCQTWQALANAIASRSRFNHLIYRSSSENATCELDWVGLCLLWHASGMLVACRSLSSDNLASHL